MANEKNERCTLQLSARACMTAALGDSFCAGCGWEQTECARRKALPLEQGEDGKYGKYGKHVGARPDCQQTQQSAGDT